MTLNFDFTAFFAFIAGTMVSGLLARHGVASMSYGRRIAFALVRVVIAAVVAVVAPATGLTWEKVFYLILLREAAAVIDYILYYTGERARVSREANKWLRNHELGGETGARRLRRQRTP